MNTRTALCFVLLGLTSFLASSLPASADSAAVDALLRAQQTANQQASYRIRTTITDASGTPKTFTVEHVKPDRFHMQNTMPNSGEIIVVGKDTYQRRGAGAWQKSKMDMGSMIAQASGGGLTKEVLASSTVTQIGPSSLEGAPMMVYAMIYAKDNVKSTGKVWIGTTDNLAHHSESDIETPVTKIGGKSFGGSSHAVGVYEYNLKIEIKAPI